MKVSLVATVKDARSSIEEFLLSLLAQTRRPDEVILVDGGSTDGTWEILRDARDLNPISEPGANIARGRNVAIRAAAHDVIAVTDADCVLAPDWLENLLPPIEAGADVAAGFYRPLAVSFFEACASAVSVPDRDELRPGWMPSSRSLAFRRDVWEAAGGYPEWLDVGEDMYLNHRWIGAGVRIGLAPDAIAYWRMRPTLAATWRQYSRYAEGDARAGMYPQRHLIRFATYAFVGAALISRNRWMLAAGGAGALAYSRRPFRRAWRRLPDGRSRLAAMGTLPALMAIVDAAKMWGYLRGLARRGGR